MANKIIKTFILMILALFIVWQIPSYATKKDNHDVYHEIKAEKEESTWISDAFAAAKSFLSETSTEIPEEGELLLYNAKMIIRGINRILWVLLGSISAISLSIVGIRYMLGINDPQQRSTAKDSLHKTIRGMALGFSAMLIFNIVMSFVRLIISSM